MTGSRAGLARYGLSILHYTPAITFNIRTFTLTYQSSPIHNYQSNRIYYYSVTTSTLTRQ